MFREVIQLELLDALALSDNSAFSIEILQCIYAYGIMNLNTNQIQVEGEPIQSCEICGLSSFYFDLIQCACSQPVSRN